MLKLKIPALLLCLLIPAVAAARTELDGSRAALLGEILAQAGAAGPAAEAALLESLRAADKAAGQGRYDSADLKRINSIWALGEIGGPDAERALRAAMAAADPTMRLNMAVAVGKIAERAGRPAPEAGLDAAAKHFEAGDILFRKGYFGLLNSIIGAQTVGHVGIYVGAENGVPMVIEGWVPVRKVPLETFVHDWPFYGNYTTAVRPTEQQRAGVVRYVYGQLGKPYDYVHTVQKGPGSFDCVGLAEAAYEAAGLNPTPDEFETGAGWPLTPTEQYEHTVPNF